MFRLTRPTGDHLDRVLADQCGREPTYVGVGGTLRGESPAGYHHDRYAIELGRGDEAWERSVAALRNWGPQRGSGLVVAADGPTAVGTTVVMAAPLPLGFALAACRVLGVVEGPDTWGFAYGTLPMHPEEGEERFTVERSGGVVTFEIVAFSRPRHPLVRLGGPVARALQVRATRRYLAAMQAAAQPS